MPDIEQKGEPQSYVIEIDRGPWRTRLVFDCPEQVINFLDREDIFWEWTESSQIFSNARGLADRYRGWTPALRGPVEKWRDLGSTEALDNVRSLLQRRYGDSSMLCAEDSAAKALAEIAKVSPLSASIALLVVHGHHRQIDDSLVQSREEVRVGLSKGQAILAGVSPEIPSAIRQSVEAAAERLSVASQELQRQSSEFSRTGSHLIAQFQSDGTEKISSLQETYNLSSEEWQKKYNELKADLEGTTAAYAKQMELAGPVVYWRGKSRVHRQSAKRLLWVLFIYALIAAFTLITLFNWVSGLIIEGNYASIFKAGAFSLVATTAVFWGARVLLRIYLSDRHLATDAEERRTMIMTFLALVRKNALGEDEKKLIMGSLFRAGSDGIVKDEAAPDTALAAVLGALLKKS